LKEQLRLTIGKCQCFSIRKAARAATAIYDGALESAGLRITQFLCLVTIRDLDGISVNALADALDLDRTTMGKNLVPLEREGLVEVRRSPTDARAKVIHLTDAGRARMEQATPLWLGAQQRMSDLLQDDLPGFRATLEKIVA
jgi:DNA-binding MarR family transcriptional regulator